MISNKKLIESMERMGIPWSHTLHDDIYEVEIQTVHNGDGVIIRSEFGEARLGAYIGEEICYSKDVPTYHKPFEPLRDVELILKRKVFNGIRSAEPVREVNATQREVIPNHYDSDFRAEYRIEISFSLLYALGQFGIMKEAVLASFRDHAQVHRGTKS